MTWADTPPTVWSVAVGVFDAAVRHPRIAEERAGQVRAGQVQLSWTAPANNGGAAVTGYRIETKTDGSWTTVTTTSDDSLAATVPATNGQRHSYRVAAINTAGESPISAATEPVRRSIPPSA